jgi:hypothetical protein
MIVGASLEVGYGVDREGAISSAAVLAQIGVPDAPFKQSWALLAMKRMVRYAAENGFDRIAWTPGAAQAERYNLSEQIDSLQLTDNDPKQFTQGWLLVARGQDGRVVMARRVFTRDQMEAAIGSELAERLLAAPIDEGALAATGARTRKLQGLDLAVGGEGMKGFYDRILPAEVGRYVRKWGAKPGRADIGGADVHVIDVTPAMRLSALEEGQP